MASGVKVLIVDDSAVVREALRSIFSKSPGISVIETAADGHAALRKLERFNADVITMDVEMPGLDGISTLKEIMKRAPRPVIMLSAFTFQGAQKTIRALELGAVDFFQKPGGPISRDMDAIAPELVAKVIAFGSAPMDNMKAVAARAVSSEGLKPIRSKPASLSPGQSATTVVAIGASTGGTEAIRHIVMHLPRNFGSGIVITQHMPEGFTLAFANRLNELSELDIKEATHHDIVRPGRVLIAPGHSHMTVHRENGVGFVELSSLPPVSGHRPSVDVLFHSVAKAFGSQSIGVELTGMGKDGAAGLLAMREAGATTAAESAETCVVFGMPKAAIDMGAAEHVVRLDEMPAFIERHSMLRQAAANRAMRGRV